MPACIEDPPCQTPSSTCSTSRRLPKAWYNLAADLPTAAAAGAAPRHPAAGRARRPGAAVPDGADHAGGLAPTREIEIPGPGARRVPAVAAVAALPRAAPRGRPCRRRRRSTTSTKASARPAATSPTPPCRRRSTTRKPASPGSSTETGAGQWGSSLAFAGAALRPDVDVFMVRVSYDQKPYRRALMETYGARCVASPSNETAVGPGDPRRARRPPRQPGHRDLRGRRGRRPARRHEVRARLGAQPRAAAPDRRSAWRRSAQMEMAGRLPRRASSAARAAGRTSPASCSPSSARSCAAGAKVRDRGRRAGRVPQPHAGHATPTTSATRASSPRSSKMHTLGSSFTPPGFHAGGLRYHGMAPMVSHAQGTGPDRGAGLPPDRPASRRACCSRGPRASIPAPEANHAVRGRHRRGDALPGRGHARARSSSTCAATATSTCRPTSTTSPASCRTSTYDEAELAMALAGLPSVRSRG